MVNVSFILRSVKSKLSSILRDEKGEVNIVAIVILIGIAVVLAIIFKDKIIELLEGLFTDIGSNAKGAMATPTPKQ